MLEIKNTIIEIKNTFEEFISRLDTNEERINEPEDRSIRSHQTEMQREEKKNSPEHSRAVSQFKRTS